MANLSPSMAVVSTPAVVKAEFVDPKIEQLRELLKSRRVDAFSVRQYCQQLKHVPFSLRTEIWQVMLGVYQVDSFHLDKSISRVEADLDNQRVIVADADRTRAELEQFRDPQTRELIARLLTFYCKRRGVRYKQGLNELVAPFILLKHPPLSDGVLFNMFYAMITKFLPSVYSDDQFQSLQCAFRLFRLLLLYHDPELCNRLDQYNMTPELYATPWFLTLFARNLDISLVFRLWDHYLIEDDPFLHHFVAFALLEAHRDTILATDAATLPETLSRLRFENLDTLDKIIARAHIILDLTPKSFRQQIYLACYCPLNASTAPLLHALETDVCLSISATELISSFIVRMSNEGQASDKHVANAVQYFVLDCRPHNEYATCHLALSYHLDPRLLAYPDQLAKVLDSFGYMENCHFSLVGRERGSTDISSRKVSDEPSENKDLNIQQVGIDEDQALARMALMLLQKGFMYVSKVEGGMAEVLKALDVAGSQLQVPLLVQGGDQETDVAIKAQLSQQFPTMAQALSGLVKATAVAGLAAPSDILRRGMQKGLDTIAAGKAFMKKIDSELFDSSSYIVFDVMLPDGPLGMLLSERAASGNGFSISIQTIVAGSAADTGGMLLPGDVIMGIGDRSMTGISFRDAVALLKDAPRPVKLRIARRRGDATTVVEKTPFHLDPPLLLSADSSSLSILWNSLPYATLYEVEIAEKNSDSCIWEKVATLQDSQVTNGSICGLKADSCYMVRVKAGNADGWGPYSAPSTGLKTAMTDSDQPDSDQPQASSNKLSRACEAPNEKTSALTFRPGCTDLERRELGTFYYKVLLPVRIRSEPDSSSIAHAIGHHERGQYVEAQERLLKPGNSQVFVKLTNSKGWLFENTPEGAQVLERVPEPDEHILNVIEAQNNSRQDSLLPKLSEPVIHVAGLDILMITWTGVDDPVLATRVRNFQLQYAVAALFPRKSPTWNTVKDDLSGDAICWSFTEAKRDKSYIARIRAGSEVGWGPWSNSSAPVQSSCGISKTSTDPSLSHSSSTTSPAVPVTVPASTRTGWVTSKLFGSSDKSGIIAKASALKGFLTSSEVRRGASLELGDNGNNDDSDESREMLKEIVALQNYDSPLTGKYIYDSKFFVNMDPLEISTTKFLVTPTEVVIAEPINANEARVIQKLSLKNLAKITSRKLIEFGTVIVFHFKTGDGVQEILLSFIDATDCIDRVKSAYRNLAKRSSQQHRMTSVPQY